MDRKWWKVHGDEAKKTFKGRLVTCIPNIVQAQTLKFKHGGNSGAGALSLAEYLGAEHITMLGYDCQYTGGKRHWHGDHPKGLGNCVSLPKFYGQFKDIKKHLDTRGVAIVNATRKTALDLWPFADLEDALESH